MKTKNAAEMLPIVYVRDALEILGYALPPDTAGKQNQL